MRELSLIGLLIFAAAVSFGAGRQFTIAYGSPELRETAEELSRAVATVPLLRTMAERSEPVKVTAAEQLTPEQKFGHLVLVGVPGAPGVRDAWQREARLLPDGRFYIFGFGEYAGDLGYLEAGRNPYWYGREAPDHRPYHAECLVLSGNTIPGVKLAAEAFRRENLINGVVSENARLVRSGLLDRVPLKPGAKIPDPDREPEGYRLIGITQPNESEYRNVLEVTGVEPVSLWRFKYLRDGWWNTPAEEKENSFDHYRRGLHRKAAANVRERLEFKSEADAVKAEKAIAASAGLKDGRGAQPPLLWDRKPAGPMKLSREGPVLWLSTLE